MSDHMQQTHRTSGAEIVRQKKPAPNWTLPAIVSVEINKIDFDEPRVRYVAGKRITHKKAVQISVQLDGPVPFRAAPPFLLVGEHMLTNFDRRDDSAYEFYGFEDDAYCEGSEIKLAWADFPASPDASEHRYAAP